MSYSLDPKRKTPWMVIDMTTEEGMEGVYAGTYEDCEMYMTEEAKHSSCIGMNIVPNPYYRKQDEMTQIEKDLLLQDLSSRLPYGVILECCGLVGEELRTMTKEGLINDDYDIDEVKPMLFPLYSMTEEQKVIYGDFCYAVINSLAWNMQAELNGLVDWLNKNHFDWRGLISLGLAKDATGLGIYGK